MPNRSPVAPIVLALLLLGPLQGRAQPVPGATPPRSAPPAVAPPGSEAVGTPVLSGKEKDVLERIRKLKEPRWRAFGACRYDWGAWRLSEGEVRTTVVECGNPPLMGSVAVHCGTLRVTRRGDDGAWLPWRLPLAVGEAPASGGEDLMVASLCANVRPAPPPVRVAPRAAAPTTPPSPVTPGARGTKPKPKVP